MRDSLRLYLRYLGVSVRGQMQYRASFVMSVVGHGLITGIEFLGLVILFQRFGTIRGWSLAEVALFYGMVNLAFAIADAVARGFDLFSRMLRAGDFDRLLLRPRSLPLQLAGQELVLRRIGRFAQALAVLIWAGGRAAGLLDPGSHSTAARGHRRRGLPLRRALRAPGDALVLDD